ncbi:MAG: hypothetical protein ABI333_15830 [bacterium]
MAQTDEQTIRVTTEDARELFVISRVFLDRQTAISELAEGDLCGIVVCAARDRFRFQVGHERHHLSGVLEEHGAFVLALQETSAPSTTLEAVVAAVLRRLFLKLVSGRPWLAALEVAEWMTPRAQAVLCARVKTTVTVDPA